MGDLRLQLLELQIEDYEIWQVRKYGLKNNGKENVDGILYH